MKLLLLLIFFFAANASAQITIEIKDYVPLPITGLVDGKTNYDALLARVSGLREEPGGANRLFVPDLVPTYPVIEYGHVPGGGDAIGAGFLYNGKAIPVVRGKYIFGDISTGRLWYADYKEMLAADDGKPNTLAQTHELKIRWNGQVYDTMFPIAEIAYHSRGGKNPDLPGRAHGFGFRTRRCPARHGCCRRTLCVYQERWDNPRYH